MKNLCAGGLILAAALAALPVCLKSQSAPAPSTQTATPANSQPQSNPPAKPKKKPEEPIDPDATAGVRGNGAMHSVQVLLKGKPIAGAHVVVKNTNGSLAASCFTGDTGECQVEIGADSYVFSATKGGRAGTILLPVDDTMGAIVIKLSKVKAGVTMESSAPKP